MMQLIHHNAMWCNGRKFCIKKLDDKRKTFDCRITTFFQVTTISSRSDRNPEVYENRYYGYLEEILECDFNSFKLVLFEVKWYRLRMNERDPERTVIEHANGFTMVNTRELEPSTEPYVLPSQCEQVFYLEIPGKGGWSYIVRYNPRGRSVKCNALEEEYNVEEEGDVDQEKFPIDIHVSYEESDQEVDHPNDVAYNEIDIDDEYLIENVFYHYLDMSDIFNDNDSKLDDDTDVEVDEEESK